MYVATLIRTGSVSLKFYKIIFILKITSSIFDAHVCLLIA